MFSKNNYIRIDIIENVIFFGLTTKTYSLIVAEVYLF